MRKIILVLIFILSFAAPCFALLFNQTDTFIITTYYPAPHGVYNRFRASKVVVGSPGGIGDFATFNGALRFKATEAPAGVQPIGTLYYSASQDKFMYYNQSGWQPVGGGGIVPSKTWQGKGALYNRAMFGGGCYGTPALIECQDVGEPFYCAGQVPACRSGYGVFMVRQDPPYNSLCGSANPAGFYTITMSYYSCIKD